MLPYRMSPEEWKRETLKREQEWRETVKRNPACPAPGTLPRKQPGICGLLRNHLRPDTRARMPRYRPSSPRRPASAREGVSRPPSPALVGSDCPQQSLLGRSPLPWSIRTSRAGLGKRRLNHRLPGKTVVSQFENACLSHPQRLAAEDAPYAGKSPSVPLWQRELYPKLDNPSSTEIRARLRLLSNATH